MKRRGKGMAAVGSLALAAVWLQPGAAFARDLTVGPGQAFASPSQAAAAAAAGDRILVAPGVYRDCVVLAADGVVLQGMLRSDPPVLTGPACADKGLVIASGTHVTVADLVLQGARSTADNGAGIRAEGEHLLVERVRFVENQNGILGGSTPGATVLVRDSVFLRNGSCRQACAHGIYVGHIASLQVERSRFFATREGHHIKSRAQQTVVTGCDIQDGPDGTASYEIDIPDGGSLAVSDTVLQKGLHTGNPRTAIAVGAESTTQGTADIRLTGVRYQNDSGRPSELLRRFP